MKIHSAVLCLLISMFALAPCRADTQRFTFKPPALASNTAAAAVMRDLAVRVLPVYEDSDRLRYLATLSALQMVAGDYKAADASRQSLRSLQRSKKIEATDSRDLLLDLYTHAKAIQASDKTPFAQTFATQFRSSISKLDNRDAYAFTSRHRTLTTSFGDALQQSFDQLRGRADISMPQAVKITRTYLAYRIHRQTAPLIDALGSADDKRRYVVQNDVLIKTSTGVILHARVVRPKDGADKLPALLEFSIVLSRSDALACAAHGYAGVMAYTRGTSRSRGRVVPFRYDGEDADAVIRWIARQPWSDGRVGMYGDGYSGFSAWAATRHLPTALKAIATADAMAPGIYFPTQGRIYQNSAFRWAATYTHGVDETSNDSDAYWQTLNQQWYRSGKRYRDLDRMAKLPNRVFRHWLNHPSYDHYWQKMIPFRRQFAKIDIPTLSMAGYYARGEAGSLHYFTQLDQYKARGNHLLLIGPYDDRSLHSRPPTVVRGYRLDSVAQVDLQELRFQWFDHVFKGGTIPALLKARVNYEVMGANQWRHVASLKAMANGVLRFYLDGKDDRGHLRLSRAQAAHPIRLTQTIDFADRSDADWQPQTALVRKHLEARNGMIFVSNPLQQPVEINGRLSGRLDFKVNKMDMDLNIAFYEQMTNGSYFQLSDPYSFRASYARDRAHRHLLKAGERQQLSFTSTRMTSRKLQAGSRIVLVLGVNKRPDQEINYGSGKDVSAESIADAGTPLKVRWYGDSRIELPVLAKAGAKPKPATASKPRHAPSPPPAPAVSK